MGILLIRPKDYLKSALSGAEIGSCDNVITSNISAPESFDFQDFDQLKELGKSGQHAIERIVLWDNWLRSHEGDYFTS